MDVGRKFRAAFGSLAVNLALAVLGTQAFSGAAIGPQGAESLLSHQVGQHEVVTARARATRTHGGGDLLSVRV